MAVCYDHVWASWLDSRRHMISIIFGGGKSGLHRAECQVMPGKRELTEESAAENKPPKLLR